MAPARLREAAATSTLEVGTFAAIETRELLVEARKLGLPVEAEDASCSSYLPIDRTVPTAPLALLICDDVEAERTAREMIAAGCAVEYSEEC